MQKFEATYNEWTEINRQLYNDSKEFILNVLKNDVPADGVILDTDTNHISISYKGGTHPEYDNNCYSEVERVYLDNGKILLDIEDANGYPIDNLTADELSNVAFAVKAQVETDYNYNYE